MNNISKKKLADKLSNLNNLLILTHERPDGDALGSTFALLLFFHELGRNVTAYFPESIPDKYSDFIPDANILYSYDACFQDDYDSVISIDCSDMHRLGMPEHWKDSFPKEKVINIDHHHDNSLFGEFNYVASNAAAAGEILFDIFSAVSGYSISVQVGGCIALAVLCDTGGLKFDNTSAHVLKKMGLLVGIGVDYVGISKKIFSNKLYSLFMLEADIAVNHLKWAFDKRFVYCFVSDGILDKYSLTLKDLEGLIDFYRVVEGVIVAALITKRDDKFKISLRSNTNDYPIVHIAHALNGGGHKLAAGCSIKTDSFDKAEQVLIAEVGKLF